MNKLGIRNIITTQCDDRLLLKNYTLLYQFNITYLIGHILILFLFIIENIPEMVIVNIFSVGWFSYNAYKMSHSEIERYEETEKRMLIEVLIHQILAFYFVGGQIGFQYILLACSTLMFTLYKNSNSKTYYILKSFIMILVFTILQFSTYLYKGKIMIPPMRATIWTILIIAYSFITSIYFTLASYTNIINSIDEYEKELLQSNNKIQSLQKQVILGLANLIESRDTNTGEHVNRTSQYVSALVEEMKNYPEYNEILTEQYVNNLLLAAPMHDIGKIKIPDSILLKPGKLSKEEFEIIKKHTIYGGEIINNTLEKIEDPSYTQMAYNITMYHHEKWNGEGYPCGLTGKNIPLEARILALVDVFDALVSERCYKEAYSIEKAYKIIENDLGLHFDPSIGAIFLSMISKLYKISA